MRLFDPPIKYDKDWMSLFIASISGELESCLKSGQRFYVGSLAETEIVILSPNGSRYKLVVADDGTLQTTPV